MFGGFLHLGEFGEMTKYDRLFHPACRSAATYALSSGATGIPFDPFGGRFASLASLAAG